MVENELLYENDVSNSRLDGKPRLHSFFNKDGLLLRTYSWTVKKAIGIFLLIHGLNGHVRLQYLRQNVEVISNDKAILKDQDNYYVYKDSWIEKLNDKGYSVYGIDLQGHGLSDGWENLKANINNFDDLVYDVIQYLEEINRTVCLDYERNKYLRAIREKNTDMKALKKDKIPIYIMGLSMGGNVVLRTLELLGKSGDYKNLNIKGCISLSGMISLEELSSKASMKYKYFLVPFSKFISYIFPKCRINQNFNFEMFPFVNDIINFDKHRSKKWITFKFGHQILRSITNLRKDIQYIPKDIPILFVHSIHDCACYYGGVVTFYDQLDNDKKELYTIYDMDHLLTMEPGNEKVLEKVLDWISGSFNNKRRRRRTSS